MRWGTLSQQFKGVGWKRLSSHEVDPGVSNGHEFQGVALLRALFGDSSKREMPARYLLLDDDLEETLVVESTISWYDSRAKNPERAAEWRLYYPAAAGAIQSRMQAGDLMVVSLTASDSVVVLLARAGSSSEAKLTGLFGIDIDSNKVDVKRFDSADGVDFTAALILEELGLANTRLTPEDSMNATGRVSSRLIQEYPQKLPTGLVVSSIVAESLPHVDPIEDPDSSMATWIEVEEAVYRQWEDAHIARSIEQGFRGENNAIDVAAFRKLAMTLRQSRVSRAGGALQNHFARVLTAHRIQFQPQGRTESTERPDFLFPGGVQYADPQYPDSLLQIVAAKFTVKERWRQVLKEGSRVKRKHLLTVDRAITTPTLKAMSQSGLTVCVPAPYRDKYPMSVRGDILSVKDLLSGPLQAHRSPAPTQ